MSAYIFTPFTMKPQDKIHCNKLPLVKRVHLCYNTDHLTQFELQSVTLQNVEKFRGVGTYARQCNVFMWLCTDLLWNFQTFSVSLEFVIGLCLGAFKCLLLSAIKLYCIAVCRIQGVAKTWKKPLWDWSLLSGWIVNLISECKITLQTLHVSRWNSLPPLCLPTVNLLSASKGEYLSWLVNFSWSFPHSLRLVSGEEMSEGVRGKRCLHLRRNMLCSALPHGLQTPCCVWG